MTETIESVEINTDVQDGYSFAGSIYRLSGKIEIIYRDNMSPSNRYTVTYQFVDGSQQLPLESTVDHRTTRYRYSSQMGAYVSLITSPQGFTLSQLLKGANQPMYANGLFWRYRPAFTPYASTSYDSLNAETNANCSRDQNKASGLPRSKL